jgi:hypothetical protein
MGGVTAPLGLLWPTREDNRKTVKGQVMSRQSKPTTTGSMTMRKKKRRKEGAVKQVGDEAGIGESRQNIRHSKPNTMQRLFL